jgi:hypothetical protein
MFELFKSTVLPVVEFIPQHPILMALGVLAEVAVGIAALVLAKRELSR